MAACSWATGSFLSPRLSMPSDPLVSTAWQMVVGGGALLASALAAGEADDLHLGAASAKSLLAFAYLVVAGSWVAFTAYAWLLQNVPISKVATYAYVNPLVAVLLGWALLSEELSVGTLAGAALIVASVATIVRRESAAPAAEPASEPRRVRRAADDDRPAVARLLHDDRSRRLVRRRASGTRHLPHNCQYTQPHQQANHYRAKVARATQFGSEPGSLRCYVIQGSCSPTGRGGWSKLL